MSTSGDTLRALVDLVRASGIDPADLAAALTHNGGHGESGEVVTFGALVDSALRRMSPNTRRTYATHLRRARQGISRCCDCLCDTCSAEDTCGCPPECGPCSETEITVAPLDDVPVTRSQMIPALFDDLATCAERIARKTAVRHNRTRTRRGLVPRPVHGHNAQETAVVAYAHVMDRAIDHGLLDTNPAARVRKRRRQQTMKRGLRAHELDVFMDTVASGGDDAALDVLIVWFHLETGARRSGALGLRVGRIHPAEQVVELHEKGSRWRRQPVSKDLCDELLAHAVARGGPRCQPGHPDYDPDAPVLYYRPRGDQVRPLTAKRYETLFRRVQSTLPFANEINLTAHGLRKSAGTIIERIGGTQVARSFLGHADRSDTDHYTESWIGEVARATSIWTGTDHPLAAGHDEVHPC